MSDAAGFRVPWNASWTGEDRYEIRPCRWADGRRAIWSPHAPGEGKPIFAKPHMVRQRRSIAQFLCTVCGEHTPENDRWWFKLGQFNGPWFLTTEAPVHRCCAELALKFCPHLKGRAEDLEPFPSGWTVLSAIVGGHDASREFGANISEHQPVVGHMKFGWPRNRFEVRNG